MRAIDREYPYFPDEEIRLESPGESLLRSAVFWENRVGGERFSDAYVLARLLRQLASQQDDLLIKKAAHVKINPPQDYVVVVQEESFFLNDEGSIFFLSVKTALDQIALIALKKGASRVQPSLVYGLRSGGISSDDVWCVEQQPRFSGKRIWSLYPIPQHIVESTL